MSGRRLIVEADGGSRGNPGPASYGAVVREAATGEVLAEVADHLGITTNNVAEYSGLVAGLTAAREIDPDAFVEVRLDSKLVVEQMSGRWKIKDDRMRALALKAQALRPTAGVSFTWIPREKNKAADALANESMDAAAAGRSGRIDRRATGSAATAVQGSLDDPPDVEASDSATVLSGSAPRPAVVGWGPDLGHPMVLTLLRHGVTASTVARRFAGSTGLDLPLNDLGTEQAAVAAKEVVERGPVEVLVCSPMLRTRQTAAAVAALTGLDPVVVDDLRECAFGDWDGHTFAEVAERWPDGMSRWLADPYVAPPGGESLAQLYDRLGAALAHLRGEYAGKRVVAVCHVGSIRALTARVLSAPLQAMNRMELPPASLTTLTWYEDGNSSIRGYGEAGYLRDLVTPGH